MKAIAEMRTPLPNSRPLPVNYYNNPTIKRSLLYDTGVKIITTDLQMRESKIGYCVICKFENKYVNRKKRFPEFGRVGHGWFNYQEVRATFNHPDTFLKRSSIKTLCVKKKQTCERGCGEAIDHFDGATELS